MGLSFCQQASAINDLFLDLKEAKKPVWFFFVPCPALSPVSFGFTRPSSARWKVYREPGGDPPVWSETHRPWRDPCRQRLHKQSRTRASALQGNLPGHLWEVIGNSVLSIAHPKHRKHPALTSSTCKALPPKPFSPSASPCSTQLWRRRAQGATLRPGSHHRNSKGEIRSCNRLKPSPVLTL